MQPPALPLPYVDYQSAKRINIDVNVHKGTIRLEVDEGSRDCHLVSFVFDALVDGSFTIFYFAKEGPECTFSPVYPEMYVPVKIPFQKGLSQRFCQPSRSGIDLGLFDMDDLSKLSYEDVFPLVIIAESNPQAALPNGPLNEEVEDTFSNAQITLAVIKKNNHDNFHVKVIKQILWIDEARYELENLPYVDYQSPKRINIDVHVHKGTIRLEVDEGSRDCHLVSFVFDALVDGSFTIFYFAKEGPECTFSPVYPEMYVPVKIPFQKGLTQRFCQPSRSGIDLGLFDMDDLSKLSYEDVFPLVIIAESNPQAALPNGPLNEEVEDTFSNAQITLAVIKKNNHDNFHVKVIKQILWNDEASYELENLPYVDYQSPKIINNYVNVHKGTIRLEVDEGSRDCHLVSFVFDALVDGSFTIFYFAKEGPECTFSPVYPEMYVPVKIPFQNGLNQRFCQPSRSGIDLGLFDMDDLSKLSYEDVFPLVIIAESNPQAALPNGPLNEEVEDTFSNAQITLAVIKKNNHDNFHVKVIKQILWNDEARYELQDRFGISKEDEVVINGKDSGKECVICMTEPIVIAVMPCRHMCMCSDCAKELKLQSKKCPICRQPMKELWRLELKV